ncbi:MAG: glycoside hydrolase family 13 protein [Treponema sp.]|nr:glycoside hydrolase family 13 protein [Treponema sp.]
MFHRPELPWCYYDRDKKCIVLRLLTGPRVKAAFLVYADPFDTEKRADGRDLWHLTETPMTVQYTAAQEEDCPPSEDVYWRIELPLPHRRRLMYRFRLETETETLHFISSGTVKSLAHGEAGYFDHFFFPFVHEVDSPKLPAWVRDTVWYQIFPERFNNGNPALSPEICADWKKDLPEPHNFFGGDIPGITKKLPYLKDLGINGIYLTPVFKAPSNHKYDTEDYFSIDEHFGTTADLKQLVHEAHALGIKVMLDAVFNHAGERHPFWQDVLKNQAASPYRDYFHIHRFPVGNAKDRRDLGYDAFAFNAKMPKWNTENPEARKYLIDAALYWIRESDIDAWRLDVANEVSFDFWREFCRAVHTEKDDFYILGEVWYDASRWINRPGMFDGVMNYPLGFAVTEFLTDQKISARQFTQKLFTVLACYGDAYNRIMLNLLDSHDTPRILHRSGGDKRRMRNAFILLFFLPGSPCVYYGTEAGMSGSEDPDCRRPMIWDESRRDAEQWDFFRTLISLRRRFTEEVNACTIRYEEAEGISVWRVGEKLTLVYTGGGTLLLAPLEKEHGALLLSTAKDGDNTLPAETVALFALS